MPKPAKAIENKIKDKTLIPIAKFKFNIVSRKIA
jgi:hypothetical protein